MTDLKKTIMRFCGGDKHKLPYWHNNMIIATDGMTLLVVESGSARIDAMDQLGDSPKCPPLDYVFDPLKGLKTKDVPLVDVELHSDKCDECHNGIGLVRDKECTHCKGCGSAVCEKCGNENPCHICNGLGYSQKTGVCESCEGTGLLPQYQAAIEGVTIRGMFLSRLKELPGCILEINGDPKQAQRFRWEFGYGAVMPLVIIRKPQQ